MISFVRGCSRTLGRTAESVLEIRISLALRDHLAAFRGSSLGVLLALALHSDNTGWACPSLTELARTSGYSADTITAALEALCDLTINHQRVLLAVVTRTRKGTYAPTHYLLFPTADELARWSRYRPNHSTPRFALHLPDHRQPVDADGGPPVAADPDPASIQRVR